MLPDLPRVLNKREAKWTNSVFSKWVMAHPIPSGPIEVKYTTTERLLFSSVAEHQLIALLACMSDKGFWWKIPDLGQRSPFDAIFYRNSPAWLVFKYPRGFVVISARAFEHEMKRDKKVKSLTWERALLISTYDIVYRNVKNY